MEGDKMTKGCPKCGRMIEEDLKICPYCKYNFEEIDQFFQRIETQKFLEEGKYAGFIKRLVAGIIDIYISLIITTISIYIIDKYTKTNYYVIGPILFTFIYVFSSAIFERTSWHASIGKKIVGIEVTDEYENPITLGTALLRNIAKFLNILTLGLGFLVCVSPPKKQTLADRITKTYVLNKVSFNEEKHDYASLSKRFVAYIIDLVIIGITSYIIIYVYNYFLKNLSMPNYLTENEKTIKILIPLIIYIIYFPLFESKRGKTAGKKYLNIRLTNKSENKISFIKSLIREILIIIDILTLGFLLPASHKNKQSIKDIITKTININD